MDWVAIGARIRNQREQFGYTREAFAEKLDITPKFCADIELGNKGMSVQTLCNILSVLKLSTDYILFGTTQEENAFSSMRRGILHRFKLVLRTRKIGIHRRITFWNGTDAGTEYTIKSRELFPALWFLHLTTIRTIW